MDQNGGIILRKLSTLLTILVLILVGTWSYFHFIQSVDKTEKAAPQKSAPQETTTRETITILATGDILMHNTVIASGQELDGYNFDPLFASIKHITSDADYSIINLESALAGPDTGYTGYPTFNSPDSLAKTIKDAGFDLVTTANNHILDRGYKGAMRTMDVLRQAGLDTTGTYKSQAEKDQFLIKDIRGVKVGFLCYGYDTNGIPLPQDKPYFYNLLDKDKIMADISTLRPQVDVLVLLLHWGVEYSPYPADQQVKLANQFFAQGADVILGGHPHVIEPAKIVNIGGKKKFVIYSMGNSIGHQIGVERNSGVIVKLGFTKDFSSGITNLSSFEYTPTFSHFNYQDGKRRFRVVPVEETIQAIRSGTDPYLGSDSIPLLETVLSACREQLGPSLP